MKVREFPQNFLWGSASSSYQTEGGNIHSDWFHWEKKRPALEICGQTTQHYERWQEDFAFLTELNQNAFRLSLEWSRLEPSPSRLDTTALEHYRAMLNLLKARGITIFLTLHHFTNPQWFAERGGWLKRGNIDSFLNFVNFVVDEFHDLVDFWFIFNEPTMYAALSYYDGMFPPGIQSYFSFREVLRNLILAHKRAYRQLHQKHKTIRIGVATNNQCFEPYSPFLLNSLVTKYTRRFWNHTFLRQVHHQLDFIGLNYYFHNRLKFSLFSDWFAPNHFFSRIKNENKIVSDNGVEIFPSGIHKVLLELKPYSLPIYITENGVADHKDSLRRYFIQQHLKYIYIAIRDLCDVRGYLYWSLTDNYEWGSFYPRHGLVAINYKNMSRRIRESARWYAEVCKKNAISF
jgi:beta-glucosidase